MTAVSFSPSRRSARRSAPSGRAHPPPSRHITDRSASSAAWDTGWSSGASTSRTVSSSPRHWSARQPCPGAGTITVSGSGVAWSRRHAQACQPGRGQHRGVDLALGELAQPRVDVAAEVADGDAGERRPGAARGGAARRCRSRRPAAATPGCARDEDVPRVGARAARRRSRTRPRPRRAGPSRCGRRRRCRRSPARRGSCRSTGPSAPAASRRRRRPRRPRSSSARCSAPTSWTASSRRTSSAWASASFERRVPILREVTPVRRARCRAGPRGASRARPRCRARPAPSAPRSDRAGASPRCRARAARRPRARPA